MNWLGNVRLGVSVCVCGVVNWLGYVRCVYVWCVMLNALPMAVGYSLFSARFITSILISMEIDFLLFSPGVLSLDLRI